MENTHAEQEESWYLLKELLNGRKAFNQFLGLCIYPEFLYVLRRFIEWI